MRNPSATRKLATLFRQKACADSFHQPVAYTSAAHPNTCANNSWRPSCRRWARWRLQAVDVQQEYWLSVCAHEQIFVDKLTVKLL